MKSALVGLVIVAAEAGPSALSLALRRLPRLFYGTAPLIQEGARTAGTARAKSESIRFAWDPAQEGLKLNGFRRYQSKGIELASGQSVRMTFGWAA
jgi:hypothetical protein